MNDITDNVFTKKYLLSEITKLREMMGTKKFWIKPERASLAIKALFYVYIKMPKSEIDDMVVRSIESLCDEFDRRLTYVILQDVKMPHQIKPPIKLKEK